MAKLNGVKTVAEIEYNGVKYVKSDGHNGAQAGDIIRIHDAGEWDVTNGAYYEVNHVDLHSDPQITDDEGDGFDAGFISDYELFRKVPETQTSTPQQYREVDRDAKVGERIKLVDAIDAYNLYRTGGELTVVAVDNDGDVAVEINTLMCTVCRGEYVVLEPITEQPEDTADRLKVGEYAKVVSKSNQSAQIGDIVKVISSSGVFLLCGDISGRELSRPAFLEERLVRATDEEVAEARRKLEISKLSVGDYVRVIVAGEDLGVGTICEVTRIADAIKVESLDDSDYYDYFRPEELEKVTKEIAGWAKIGREVGEFKVGDIVRIIANTNGSVNPIGSIGEVVEPPAGGEYRVYTGGRSDR